MSDANRVYGTSHVLLLVVFRLAFYSLHLACVFAAILLGAYSAGVPRLSRDCSNAESITHPYRKKPQANLVPKTEASFGWLPSLVSSQSCQTTPNDPSFSVHRFGTYS